MEDLVFIFGFFLCLEFAFFYLNKTFNQLNEELIEHFDLKKE